MRLQPIETAPRDGSRVVLFKIGQAYDPVNETYLPANIWWITHGYYNERADSWNDGAERLVPPTHWLPITEFEWEK